MKEHTIRIKGLEEYPQAAREFIRQMQGARIFAFYGKMGSGKTTLIKSICEELGVEDSINSPTFAIWCRWNNISSAAFCCYYTVYFFELLCTCK